MSRSRRKTPVCKYFLDAKRSEKWWKQLWHRQMRAHNWIRPHIVDEETFLLRDYRECNTNWDFGNSGKVRFDPLEYPKLMRK